MISTVKWFNNEKGYGFIRGETEDIFVHISSCATPQLFKGQIVEFEIVKTIDGLKAKNVKVIQQD